MGNLEVGFHEPTIMGSPRAAETKISAERDFREVGSIKQAIFGNDISDDFALKLPYKDKNGQDQHLVIQPENAKALLQAAQAGSEVTIYEDGKAIGTMDSKFLQEALKAYR